MAIYHLSVKTISRAKGRSATAAIAYRAAEKIIDERTGDIHDYSRKSGVVYTDLVLPIGAPEWAANRSALWNSVEQAETRRNSTVAREFEIALPEELSPAERCRLARDFAEMIVNRHGCAADVAIHAPSKDGDNRNYHAHILLSTRRLGPDGFVEKTRELDDQKTGPQIVKEWREQFAILQNERLRQAGIQASVDHRTLEAQGIDRDATRHLGPVATGYERRTKEKSEKRIQQEEEAAERLDLAKLLGDKLKAQKQSIIDLLGNLQVALFTRKQFEKEEAERKRQEAEKEEAERKRQEAAELERAAELGIAKFLENFEILNQQRQAQAQADQPKEQAAKPKRQAARMP